MPPATKKDIQIIVFDVNCTNKNLAQQTLLKICCNEAFTESSNIFKLILTNVKETKNRLHDRYGGHDHINEVFEHPLYYKSGLETVFEQIESAEPAEAKWFEALSVAIASVEDFKATKGIVTYQILFISDFMMMTKETAPIPDQDTINDLVKDLDESGAYLYFVGADVEFPFRVTSNEMLQVAMSQLKTGSGHLKVVQEIIERHGFGLICGFKPGIHLYKCYKNFPGKQPWNVPLKASSKIEFASSTCRVLEQKARCQISSVKSHTAQQVFYDASKDRQEVEPEDLISGYEIHGKFIQINDMAQFKSQTERSFQILCFVEASEIPEWVIGGEGSYYVFPKGPSDSLSVLIDCLYQKDKYVIAKRVYNRNYNPNFCILIPKLDGPQKCLILSELPCADDIKFEYEPTTDFSNADLSPEIGGFLDSIDVKLEENTKKMPLCISMMQDFNYQAIVNKAADKKFDRYLHLEEADFDYLHLDLDTAGGKGALKGLWPDREEAQKEVQPVVDEDMEWF